MKLKTLYKCLVSITMIIVGIMCINVVFAFGPSSDEIYQGIDVSEWQGNIDFEEVRASGIELVYIKASEGADYIDNYFEENYTKAKESGLKIGFYHYLTARNTEEARIQAEFFAKVISSKEADLRLAMDFEYFDGLSINEINEISEVFLSTLQEITEKEVVIYSDASNARDVFSERLTIYPLWVANYFVEEPADNGKWETWVGFQYTDRGIISGINARVDRDEFTDGIFLEESGTFPDSENKPITEKTIEYIVKSGDTLTKIAMEFGTTVERLVIENNIRNANIIFPGQILKIVTANNRGSQIQYVVQRGNTLTQIARYYATTVEKIVEENNIQNHNYIYIGEVLRIPTAIYDIYDMSHTIYRVKRGNTLTQIAREYDTTVLDIAEINDIRNVNRIYVGEVLRIY